MPIGLTTIGRVILRDWTTVTVGGGGTRGGGLEPRSRESEQGRRGRAGAGQHEQELRCEPSCRVKRSASWEPLRDKVPGQESVEHFSRRAPGRPGVPCFV